MNIPLARTLCLPAPSRTAPPVGEATAVALGASLSAVFFDRPAGRRGRLQVEQDGTPLARPFIAAELPLASGALRHLLLIPQGIDALLSAHLTLHLGAVPMAEIDPRWLQLPQGDLAALAAQLSEQGLRRLLRAMLTTGASLFIGPAQAGLADAVPRLMDLCAIPALAPVAATRIAGSMLVSHAVPGLREPADAVAMLDGRLIRLKHSDTCVEGGLLHLLLPSGLAAAQVVVFADAPLRLAAADAALRRLPVRAWLQGRGQACRDWLTARLGDGAAPVLEGDFAPGMTDPKITVRHLSQVPAGLLHLLMLQDPARTVRRVILERRGRRAELTPSHGVDGTAVLAGFADLSDEGGGPCRIRVLHHSGRLRTLAEAPVAAYDGAIPAGFEDAWAWNAAALRPLAQARAAFRRDAPPSATQHFGPTRTCGLRIVTAIGDSVDPVRARAAMILAEGHNTPVEVVCTMTDGPLAEGARHALAQTAAIYDIPHRLVLLPPATTGGERLRAVLSQAQDAPALVLSGDTLPGEGGWLAFWLRRLRRQGVLAPALLAGDGSIAATCEGEDPFQGLPRTHLPASGRRADRPLADCLALGSGGIARLLAADAPHPDPAVWIARILGGLARTETRFPFRRLGPGPAPSGFAAALADAEFAMIEKNRE